MVRGSNYSANSNVDITDWADSPYPYYPWVTVYICMIYVECSLPIFPLQVFIEDGSQVGYRGLLVLVSSSVHYIKNILITSGFVIVIGIDTKPVREFFTFKGLFGKSQAELRSSHLQSFHVQGFQRTFI